MRSFRKTDFRSRDIANNNFIGIDISHGLDLEPRSLFRYFLLITDSTPTAFAVDQRD